MLDTEMQSVEWNKVKLWNCRGGVKTFLFLTQKRYRAGQLLDTYCLQGVIKNP